MEKLQNSGLKVAEENLMKCVREGKESIIQTRKDILNGDLKPKDKYDAILESLYNINLKPEVNKEQIKYCLKGLIVELKDIIDNRKYDDYKYLRNIILRIDISKKNLKYIVDDYAEQIKYEDILGQIKYQLTLKLFAISDKEQAKQHIICKNQK